MLLLFGCTPENPTPNPTSFTIGQSYQGGIIAYIDASGLHGLIAAPSNQGTAKWGCNGTGISGADGVAIGTGAQNTLDIMNGCSEAGIAARICGDLVLGSYSDWYLPSIDELNLLYINRIAIGGFTPNGYWSSTEFGNGAAEYFRFNFGSAYYTDKGITCYVRAVRSF